jgi:hypothetical protein
MSSTTNFKVGMNMGAAEEFKSSRILIGLVTHPKSSAKSDLYKECIGYFELGFKENHWQVTSILSEENSFNGKVGLTHTWRSKWANIRLVQNWIHFVAKSYTKEKTCLGLREIIDLIKCSRVVLFFALKTIVNPQLRDLEKNKLIRNINISLSHLKIMNSSRNSLADLTMILEDDSLLRSNEDLLNDLIIFSANSLAKSNNPSLLSLSDSLPRDKLFVSNSNGVLPQVSFSRNIFLPKIMHHNTTCAVIYNQKYIESVFTSWEESIQKFIYQGLPIDWIINALILKLPNNSLFTFHSTQSLIVQGSLHGESRVGQV